MLAARDADDGVRVPHGVALDIMRELKPGSTSALARIASAPGTTIDVLVSE